MKYKLIIPVLLLLSAFLLAGCIDNPITSDENKFIGTWKCTGESTYIIMSFGEDKQVTIEQYHTGESDPFLQSYGQWEVINDHQIKTIVDSTERIVEYTFTSSNKLVLDGGNDILIFEKTT